ncbi:MAG: phosphatase PAP2 family protein [Saprospiraceae bacterium]|nr:phosphatase PAP2 family protein [Lewinella sp.]
MNQLFKWVLPLIFAGLTTVAVWAQGDGPYYLSLKQELLYTLGGASTTFLGNYLRTKTPELTRADLELEGINFIDRIATQFSSEQADRLSDKTLVASVGLPLLLLAGQDSRRDFVKISILFGETMLINQGLTDMIKSIALRPRPYVFDENLPPSTILRSNDRASFLSGHTSGSAAASFFFARVFTDYYPDSKLKPYVWGLAFAMPALTGYLRIRGGQHYPTDVVAGYALGASIGYFLPKLHWKDRRQNRMTMMPTGNGFYLNVKL